MSFEPPEGTSELVSVKWTLGVSSSAVLALVRSAVGDSVVGSSFEHPVVATSSVREMAIAAKRAPVGNVGMGRLWQTGPAARHPSPGAASCRVVDLADNEPPPVAGPAQAPADVPADVSETVPARSIWDSDAPWAMQLVLLDRRPDRPTHLAVCEAAAAA